MTTPCSDLQQFAMFLKNTLILVILIQCAQSYAIYDLIDPDLLNKLPCQTFWNGTRDMKMWAIRSKQHIFFLYHDFLMIFAINTNILLREN